MTMTTNVVTFFIAYFFLPDDEEKDVNGVDGSGREWQGKAEAVSNNSCALSWLTNYQTVAVCLRSECVKGFFLFLVSGGFNKL